MLNLSRPLVFFDLETTGVDVYHDRIIQIGAVKIMPDGKELEYEWLINPGMPIPKEATDVHGITNEMLKDKPRLGDLAAALSELFLGADVGGYNVKNFDVPMLMTELNRIGVTLNIEETHIVDAMAIFKKKEPRTLAEAYKKYCGKELMNAHNAMADIKASIEVLDGQLSYYSDLPYSPEALHEYCFPKDPDAYDAEGKLKFIDEQLTINFGKNKGKRLQDLAMNDPGYLEWILHGNFSEKVKSAVKKSMK